MHSVGSLFSGIGGLDLGLERAGWTVLWQVERDEWCRRVLAKHWPHVPRYGAVESVGEGLAPVDLIAGGFPCQPFSLAGKQGGIDDDRWLWPEFVRIIRLLRPRYALLENVPGILTGWGGMGEVLADLATCGYDAEWTCVPAAAVGAPHVRWRVFIVAHPAAGAKSRTFTLAHASRYLYRHGHDGKEPLFPRRAEEAEGSGDALPAAGQWSPEPALGRMAYGVPHRVDRLRGLGNAVVPQVAEAVGRMILAAMAEEC